MEATTNVRYRIGATSAMERANVPSECSCCGREDLKKTVKLVPLAGGSPVWFGTGCAAKALGMGVPAFRKEAKRLQDEQDARDFAARAAADRRETEAWFAWLTARAGSAVVLYHGQLDVRATALAAGFEGVIEARRVYRAETGRA